MTVGVQSAVVTDHDPSEEGTVGLAIGAGGLAAFVAGRILGAAVLQAFGVAAAITGGGIYAHRKIVERDAKIEEAETTIRAARRPGSGGARAGPRGHRPLRLLARQRSTGSTKLVSSRSMEPSLCAGSPSSPFVIIPGAWRPPPWPTIEHRSLGPILLVGLRSPSTSSSSCSGSASTTRRCCARACRHDPQPVPRGGRAAEVALVRVHAHGGAARAGRRPPRAGARARRASDRPRDDGRGRAGRDRAVPRARPLALPRPRARADLRGARARARRTREATAVTFDALHRYLGVASESASATCSRAHRPCSSARRCCSRPRSTRGSRCPGS